MVILVIDEEFDIIGLYKHNANIYRNIRSAYDSGEDIIAFEEATGAGKTYNALQFAYDHRDKRIMFVEPSKSIIEHIKQTILDNPNLDMERDFSNLEFRTYQSFINLSQAEIEKIQVDIVVVDEFHHLGGPVWGARINMLKKTHSQLKILGMSAYTTWGRGTSYERNLTDPSTNELFSGKLVSRYDVVDAMIDGVLPKPIYRCALINLLTVVTELDERNDKLSFSIDTYKESKRLLKDLKRRIAEAPSVAELMKNNIKPNGKYIYFCPIEYEPGVNDIESIQKEAMGWFKQFVPEEDIIFYTTTSRMGNLGKLNRDAFYRDQDLNGENVDFKLRVMFAINQYNEGVHAPNIDGVILGRETKSDIVFHEEIGRGLSVKGNMIKLYEKYDQYSKEELLALAHEKNLPINDHADKAEIIEKLLAPVIIDLSGNISFMMDLEARLNDRLMDIRKQGEKSNRQLKLQNASFDIDVTTIELFKLLRSLKERLSPRSWDNWFDLACEYVKFNGDLKMPYNFITDSTYTVSNAKLGVWLYNQKVKYNNGDLEESKKIKLESIGLIVSTKDKEVIWHNWYDLATKYYEHYHNLLIPCHFKTKNGYDYHADGMALGTWIVNQRVHFRKGNISEDKIVKLNQIGMIYDLKPHLSWDEWYALASNYYNYHHNLKIAGLFKTINGYDYNDNGYSLGTWIYNQRKKYTSKTLSQEQIAKLERIGMSFQARKKSKLSWAEWYALATKYYEYYHHLQIPVNYKTINGIEYDENGEKLGVWLKNQKKFYDNNKLTVKQIELLEAINIIWNNRTNAELLDALLKEYNIDNNIDTTDIKRIPYRILKAKIHYLISHNQPLFVNSAFHRLLFMSNVQMKEIYNISLEELIEKYYQMDYKSK